jgi:hypothetical protein
MFRDRKHHPAPAGYRSILSLWPAHWTERNLVADFQAPAPPVSYMKASIRRSSAGGRPAAEIRLLTIYADSTGRTYSRRIEDITCANPRPALTSGQPRRRGTMLHVEGKGRSNHAIIKESTLTRWKSSALVPMFDWAELKRWA